MKKGRYSKEFKHEAIRLLMAGDKPVTELARELGVKRSLLYTWRDQYRQSEVDESVDDKESPEKASARELKRLRAENEALKEELEILKKAAAYFARNLK